MRSAFMTLAMAGAALLVASGTASASALAVNVPFSFLVGSESFPAGHYMVEQGGLIGSKVLLIRGMHTPDAAFVLTETAAGQGPARPALQFSHRENHYRLTNVWESQREGQTIVQPK